MKIKRFNQVNATNIRPESPSIYIHHSGKFCISGGAATRIGVLDDETQYYIEVIQDEENPKDWYLALSNKEAGFNLRKEKKGNKYGFNSKLPAKEILRVLPKTASSTTQLTASLLIGCDFVEADGLKLWPIITSSFQPKTK